MIIKNNLKVFLIALAVLFIAAAGINKIRKSGNAQSMRHANTESGKKEILYYTCGMHPSVRVSSEEFKKGNTLCPICNMKLTPVYKEGTATEAETKKILFYRNPMNPSITSSVPAKDEMGMDYIPVYEDTASNGEYYGCGMEGEEHVFQMKGGANMKCPFCGMPLKKLSKEEADKLRGIVSRVKINGEEASLAGVETQPVKKYHLYNKIRTVGTVAYDPQLAVAQEEFISSVESLNKIQQGNIPEIKERAMKLVESARKKLKLLGMSDEQIDELREGRRVQDNLVLPEDKMWIYADVYEYELSWVKVGEKIKVTASGLPGEEFQGVIASMNPVVDPKTRSVRIRAQVDNPHLRLKPQMYVDVEIMSDYSGPQGEDTVLAIPKASLLDTGMRKIVWADKGKGEYVGKEVSLGPQASAATQTGEAEFYPVLKGLTEGEMVVTKANFLIDSQSQISGTAASAYAGAIGAKDEDTPAAAQQH